MRGSTGERQPTTPELVLGVAALMVVAQVAFRAWALYPSWFYLDDYRLIYDGTHSRLDAEYLARPYDSQFMPFGRFLAWVVGNSGHLDWTLCATLALGLQLLASVACVWMLVVVFGRRWLILLPLGIYLSGAMTMPALMWWAAGLNQLPIQIVFFASVATWTMYLRERRLRWLVATIAVLAFGLLCYVKTLLVFLVLAYLVVAYFGTGRIHRRLGQVVTRYWPAVIGAGVLGAGFLWYYVSQVPQILTTGETPVAGELAESMVGRSLSVGILGGPWRWNLINPPVGLADPPDWSVHLAWVLLALTVAYVALQRRRTGRAWLLLGAYVVAAYLLLLTTRAQVVGAVGGLEYRYLTDTVCVLTLCVGLATMRIPGVAESSEPRDPPVLTLRIPQRPAIALFVVLLVSGITSSVAYARIWHDRNPGELYFQRAASGVGDGQIDLPEQTVPGNLMPGFLYPYNTTRILLPLLSPAFTFPDSTGDLKVLDDEGGIHTAGIDTGVTSRTGPDPGCGYEVSSAGRTIDLTGEMLGLVWWIKIGYLSSQESPIIVRAGDDEVATSVHTGLNSLFVRVEGSFDAITLTGMKPGVTLCVDKIEVGDPVPEEDLEGAAS